MKILHILDHSIPLHSGYSFRTKNILEGQAKLGLKTYHITSPKHGINNINQLNYETIDGLSFYRTENLFSGSNKIPIVRQWATIKALEIRLKEVIKQINPDILHAHSPCLNAIAALKAVRKLSIPVVYEVRAFWEDAAVDHGTHKENSLRYKLSQKLETRVFNNVDALVTICEGLKNDMVERGIDDSKITIVPNSIEPKVFSQNLTASSLKEKLGLQNRIILSFIGSFYAYEGLDLLLNTMELLTKYNDDIRLLLVGGGQEEEKLKLKVKVLNLEDYVKFVGRVENSKVPEFYKISDICIYPRTRMRLTELVTPLKPLEAMASRCLVVASNVGGHKELIKDRKTGIFFDAGDCKDLANVIKGLVEKREIWQDMKNQAFKYVTQERTWANSVSNYIPIYDALCG